MGGFVSKVISRFGETVAKGVEEDVFSSEGSRIGSVLHEYAGNQRMELDATPEGKTIRGFIELGHAAEGKYLKQLNSSQQALWEGIKADPQLAARFNYGKDTLGTIDQHLQATNHPLSMHSSALKGQNMAFVKGAGGVQQAIYPNADMTLRQIAYASKRQAQLMGQETAMGKNMKNVAPLIMSLRDSGDANKVGLAQRYADIIHNEFKDKEVLTGYTEEGLSKSPQSVSKLQLNKGIQIINKARKAAGSDIVPVLNTESIYSDPNAMERWLTGFLHAVQTPLAVLPHLSMEANLYARSPTRAMLRALQGVSKGDSDRIIEASGILHRTHVDMLARDIAARTGVIAKRTTPGVGSMVDKIFHTPLLNNARLMQLRHAGAAGYHTAIYWGERLSKNNFDKMASEELRQMHIDPAEALHELATNRRLSDKQLENAVYHYTNDTMLLGTRLHMPLKSDKSAFWRSANMYHTFIRHEAFFLQRTLGRMMRGGDTAGIARFIGVLGVAWPAAAPLLMGLEKLGRTGSPTQALTDVKDQYRKLVAPDSDEEWIDNYTMLLAHIGAAGTFYQMWNSTKGYGLIKSAIGPKIGTPLTFLQDAATASMGKSAKPIVRDALQLLPLIGKPLSHIAAPSRAEERLEHPKVTFKRRTSLRKKPKGW